MALYRAWSQLFPSLSQQKSSEEMQEEDKEGDEGIEKELQEDEGVGSASSSSSSSASASDIIWVSPQSLQLKADVWTTDLYNISKKAVSNGKRQMKCLECEKNSVHDDWGCGNQIYNGTAMPHHHAESVHSKLPKVSIYLERFTAKKQAAKQAQIAQKESLKEVSCLVTTVLFHKLPHAHSEKQWNDILIDAFFLKLCVSSELTFSLSE